MNRLPDILRATYRVMALCLLTAAIYLIWLGGLLFVFALTNHRERWRSFIFRRWAQAVACIAGMKISVRGEPPPPPFLLVANHLSYMDIVALAAHVDSCTFVAKSEVGNWPVMGRLCRSMRTIFINRKLRSDIPRVLVSIRQAQEQGSGVVLFAEGTSTAGAAVAPFKSSLLDFAARSRMPVHYASLSYLTPPHTPPAASAVCWWGDMTFPRHLFGLLGLRSFEAKLIFGSQPVQAADRKVLSHRLWAAVSAQFSPLAGMR